jgi:DNA-binding NarL/FixJ family response regulator
MAKRNGLWHAEAMELAKRYSPATIALIVHVSERQVRRLLAANARGGAASDQKTPTENAVDLLPTSPSAPDSPSGAENKARQEVDGAAGRGSEGAATVKSAARDLLEAIVEPSPVYAPAAPRRAEAVAALAGGATITETARQLGCTRAQVDRMRDSAALGGEIAPPAPADDGDKVAMAAKRRCDAHLADLVAVYGAPAIDAVGRPLLPRAARCPTRRRAALEEGPMPIAAAGYQGSGASSPAAACVDLG